MQKAPVFIEIGVLVLMSLRVVISEAWHQGHSSSWGLHTALYMYDTRPPTRQQGDSWTLQHMISYDILKKLRRHVIFDVET